MLQIISYILVEQCTNNTNFSIPIKRDSSFYMTLFEEIEINKGTEDLVQTARIKLPRRIIINPYKRTYQNERGMEIKINGFTSYLDLDSIESDTSSSIIPSSDLYKTNNFAPYTTSVPPLNDPTLNGALNTGSGKYVSQNVGSPVFQMGDMITIWVGYILNDQTVNEPIRLNQQFRGYIASISAGEHIELFCEDFMWYFKQLRIPNIRYELNENYNEQNDVYYADEYLNGVKTRVSKPITYIGKTSLYLDNSHDQTEGNNYDYRLASYPANSKNPEKFSINDLQGVLYDLLNRTTNDDRLTARGIYPLAWVKDTDGIPTPAINIAGQGTQSARNVTLESNGTVFKFFEHLHETFGLSVYFWQQSPSYHLHIGQNNVPYSPTIKTETPWPGFYLNLGWDQYLPWDSTPIYQPQYYDIYLNGDSGNVISNNLTWVRADEKPTGVIVKSTKQAKLDSAVKNNKTTSKNSKTKTYGSSVLVGDISGSLTTRLHSTNVPMDDKGQIIIKAGDIIGEDLKQGAIYDMAKFGYSELSKVWYTGYHGTLKILGLPFIYPGDIINIHDKVYPERTGYYKIKKVSIKCNTSDGLTQELHLHYIVNGETGNALINYSTNGDYSNLNKAPVYYHNDSSGDKVYYINLNGTSK